MDSTEVYTPPLTRGRKRAAEVEEKRKQNEEEVMTSKRQCRMPSPPKMKEGSTTSLATRTRRNAVVPDSKNVQKTKIKEELKEKPTINQTPTVEEELRMECPSQVNPPDQVGLKRCQDLEKIVGDRDLRIKQLEGDLESQKNQATIVKLCQEADADDEGWGWEDKKEENSDASEHENRNTPVFLAALQGKSKEEIINLVESGEEFDVPNAKGDTIFHIVAKTGRSDLLQYFISISSTPPTRPNLNARNSSGSTPLMEAAKNAWNFLEMFDIFMEHGADLNDADKHGVTQGVDVIHCAIAAGRSVEEIRKIENSCANWNFRDLNPKTGLMVLHVAAMNGNLKVLEYFSSRTCFVNPRSTNLKQTPLMCAVMAKENFTQMVDLLLREGADINLRDAKGFNILHLAVHHRRSLSDLKKLISSGAVWNTRSIHGRTIIHTCAENGHVAGLEYFIGQGANVNEKDLKGATPIMRAVKYGMCQALNTLNRNGANFEASDLLRHCLANYTSAEQRKPSNLLETVKRLLELGAVWKDDLLGKALFHFVEDGNLEGVRYCKMNGVDVNARNSDSHTPIMVAIVGRKLQLEVFNLLVEMGADINAMDECGFNVLYLATSMSYHTMHYGLSLEILEKLIQHGGTWSKTRFETILHAGVRGGRPDVVQYFVLRGVDVNAKNCIGETPFFLAARDEILESYGEILRILVNSGANPNLVDCQGNSPLLAACRWMNVKVAKIKLLVALGCNWKIPNDEGKTVLSVLKKRERLDLLKYFKSSV